MMRICTVRKGEVSFPCEELNKSIEEVGNALRKIRRMIRVSKNE
jgi:hypothetical protein